MNVITKLQYEGLVSGGYLSVTIPAGTVKFDHDVVARSNSVTLMVTGSGDDRRFSMRKRFGGAHHSLLVAATDLARLNAHLMNFCATGA